MDIQSLILTDDRRGIATIAATGLRSDNLEQIARQLLKRRDQTVLIATGFFVENHTETDGPPGALALGAGLHRLGHRIVFVSRADALEMLRQESGFTAGFEPFQPGNRTFAERRARAILRKHSPAAAIAIEVLGPDRFGCYRSMKGRDLSSWTPAMDLLFDQCTEQGIYTVGIGDGGNEIGFGNVPAAKLRAAGVEPCRTRTSALIAASVSNWGSYGLLSVLSQSSGQHLLPSLKQVRSVIRGLVHAGAVDGFSGKSVLKVDGRSLSNHEEVLRILRQHATITQRAKIQGP